MELFRIRTAEELLREIETNAGFVDLFVTEVTVNTTEMFRDPSFWKLLQCKVFPELARMGKISIWHAACSTGEEVFTMCILLKQAGLLNESTIIATDINPRALDIARKGVYPLKSQRQNQFNFAKVTPNGSLSDYFTPHDSKVRFHPDLLENVTFLIHDLATRPPFSRFHLIICRNTLIYFNSALQERVIRIFSDNLHRDGFLGIGNKESLSWCKSAGQFTPVSLEDKIFRYGRHNKEQC